jgi:hypothetical protein
MAQLAERAHDTSLTATAMSIPAYLAFVDGHIEDAIGLIESLVAESEELGVSQYLSAGRPLFYLGRGSEAALELWEGATRFVEAGRILLLAYLGRHEEAHTMCEHFVDIGSDEDGSGVHVLLSLLEAAILGSDVDTVRMLSRRLAPLAQHLGYGPRFHVTVSVARLLGASAALLGDPDGARTYYQQSLEICAKTRFRPEIALTRLQLAELLLEHYPAEQAEAQSHLDFAIEEFRAMKMLPSLERALSHKGLLHA